MHKGTSNSEQAHTRTGNHSTRGSAKGFVEGLGENAASVLTSAQAKENLRLSIHAERADLSAQLKRQKQESNELLHARDIKGHHASVEKCNAIRDRVAQLTAELVDLNLDRKMGKVNALSGTAVQQAFIDICRETMTKPQFQILMRQAKARAAEQASMTNERSA